MPSDVVGNSPHIYSDLIVFITVALLWNWGGSAAHTD